MPESVLAIDVGGTKIALAAGAADGTIGAEEGRYGPWPPASPPPRPNSM